jgi:histidine ammonia-lyase/tyrosine ammonia-lyase
MYRRGAAQVAASRRVQVFGNGGTMVTVSAEPAVEVVRLPGRLTPAVLESAAAPIEVTVSNAALQRVAACRRFVLDRLANGDNIYGSTTGFGPLVVFDGREQSTDQCDSIVYHLTAGQGDDLPPDVVRAAVLTRLWSLAQGHSGVSVDVVSALVAMLRTEFTPAVPRIGSVGASGDLIPLSYVAGALRGEGFAYLGGARQPAHEALQRAGLEPLRLDGRDGLALVNGTSVTAAAAGLAVAAVSRSLRAAMMLTAIMIDVLGSAPGFLSANLLQAFGHSSAGQVAARLRGMLDGCAPTGLRPLQEPYSIRCTPQLLGAVTSSVEHVTAVIDADLNGISDNPLFFPDADEVAHGGNFFGQPVAFAADLLSTAIVQMGNLAERQLDLLIDPHRNNGLPIMLARVPGKQHGVQGVQLAATATVAMMRRLCMPASMQSLPTNGHNQDVVPFGTQAALNALELSKALRWLHGSLAVALRQTLYVGGRRPNASVCGEAMDILVRAIDPIEDDRPLDHDVRSAADILDDIADSHLTARIVGY